MRKITTIIAFIFIFKSMGYCLPADSLRVPIGIKKDRIQTAGYVKEEQVKALMAEIKRIVGKEISHNTALQIFDARVLTAKAVLQ